MKLVVIHDYLIVDVVNLEEFWLVFLPESQSDYINQLWVASSDVQEFRTREWGQTHVRMSTLSDIQSGRYSLIHWHVHQLHHNGQSAQWPCTWVLGDAWCGPALSTRHLMENLTGQQVLCTFWLVEHDKWYIHSCPLDTMLRTFIFVE